MPSRFDEFWALYPHKVGKLLAPKAYQKALKIASHEEIMAGLERYKATKEDWRIWKGPAAWLNAGMWMDEPAGGNKLMNGSDPKSELALQNIANHVKRPWCEIGTYPREVLEQCVAADLLTREQMEAVL